MSRTRGRLLFALALALLLAAGLGPTAAAPGIGLPAKGRLVFQLSLGSLDFVAGRSEHTWEHDGRQYRLRNEMETTGIAALLRSIRYVQTSEGDIAQGGLRPRQYRAETLRKDKRSTTEARFDWQAGVLHLRRNDQRSEAPLEAGTQDVLSLFYQMGIAPPGASQRMTNGRRLVSLAVESLGEEQLATPVGQLRTLHLRTRNEARGQEYEVWLALDYRHLPVRMRYREEQGDEYDLLLAELEIEGVHLQQAPKQARLP